MLALCHQPLPANPDHMCSLWEQHASLFAEIYVLLRLTVYPLVLIPT